MSIELKQAAQQALEALTFIRRKLKSWDRGDSVIDALRTALAQQPATPKPVGFTYQSEIEYADSTGGNGSFWRVPPDLDDEAVPLYTHQAPSVPDDVVRDAERYRWLRDHAHWPAPFSSSQEPEPVRGRDLDAAIDAAMLAAKDSK